MRRREFAEDARNDARFEEFLRNTLRSAAGGGSPSPRVLAAVMQEVEASAPEELASELFPARTPFWNTLAVAGLAAVILAWAGVQWWLPVLRRLPFFDSAPAVRLAARMLLQIAREAVEALRAILTSGLADAFPLLLGAVLAAAVYPLRAMRRTAS